MRKFNIIKAVIFLLLCSVIMGAAAKVFIVGDKRNLQWVKGFYEEPADSLDAVYIGASNVYAFWQAPVAWGHYGIAVFPFNSSGQPFEAAEIMVKEARKKQPDALYIISLSSLDTPINESKIHFLTDFMPDSQEKHEVIEHLSDASGFSQDERLEYYFPMLRFHSRWSELNRKDFDSSLNGLKGGLDQAYFLEGINDITNKYQHIQKKRELSQSNIKTIESLLSYCDSEKIRVLFTVVPQTRDNEIWEDINAAEEIIRSHGYPVLDIRDHSEELGLDFETDFYNDNHTNLHGSLKITEFLADYLVKKYGFRDKRGEKEYALWDKAYEKYTDIIASYSMPFEYSNIHRDFSLEAPVIRESKGNGSLTWSKVDGTDGYGIYRQKDGGEWILLDKVDPDTLSWRDNNKEDKCDYEYMVVAYSLNGEVAMWGKYDVWSISKQYYSEE